MVSFAGRILPFPHRREGGQRPAAVEPVQSPTPAVTDLRFADDGGRSSRLGDTTVLVWDLSGLADGRRRSPR
jgi:hypothetical protein